ncbi:MAG: hypothetical protein Q7U60_02255 [Candidatus Methanoperedens sp.]|nr:hypothetical protein [Candidatus Methanoperedens sp.]
MISLPDFIRPSCQNLGRMQEFSSTTVLLRKTNRTAQAREMEERARGIRGGGKGG